MVHRTGAGTATRTGWGAVVLLASGGFAVGTDMFVVGGVLVGLAADLDVPVGTAGLAGTAFALAYAAGAASFGPLLGGRPLRPVLVGAPAVAGLCAAAAALAPAFPVLLAARVLGGFAASAYLPAAGAAAAAAVAPDRRGRALGAVLGAGSAAMVLGAPAGVLLAGLSSWRAAFGLVAVLAAVTVGGLLRGGAGAGGTVGTSRGPALRPPVVATLAVTVLVTTGSNAVFAYLAAVLPAAGPAGLASVIAAFGVGGLAGSWWGGGAVDRWGGRVVARRALAALVGVFAVLPLAAPTPVGGLAVTVTWGAAVWAFVAAQQHRLIVDPGAAPALLALHSAAIHAGFAIGALAGGLVVDATGADPLSLLAATCCGAGLIVHTLLTKETS
jgi:predicted MFS family arabinose efflux permease